MKTKFLKSLVLLSLITLLVSSCGVGSPSINNLSTSNTTIELNKANFKVVEHVSGTSTSTYYFGIGGFSNKALIDLAKSEMMESADLIGYSKAIINVTTDVHRNFILPFYYKKTVTVSGYVIEFVETEG